MGHRISGLVTGLLLLTLLGACSPAEPAATSAGTDPIEVSPSASVPAAPSPTPSPEPVLVALSETGVGEVAFGTPGALALVLELLGPAEDRNGDGDVEEPVSDDCGPGAVTAIHWGDLVVNLQEGNLFGWTVRGPALPDVTTPYGIVAGDPLTDVMAVPGATEPFFQENLGLWQVGLGDVWYHADGATAETATVLVFGINTIVCG